MTKKKIREKIPKTKTFTGCWTCRGRKVKCDASRPQCTRCKKAGLRCEGYGIKLHWITDQDVAAPSAIKRQAMSLASYQQWSFNLTEVECFLDRIDECHPPSSSGPFHVFAIEGLQGDVIIQRHLAKLDDNSPNTVETIDSSEEWLESTRGIELTGDNVSSSHENFEHIESPNDYSISDQFIASSSFVSFPRPLQDMQDWLETLPAQLSMTTINHDALTGCLLENYIQNVTSLLQPIPHLQNSYSAMYVPSAIVGSSKVHTLPWTHDASFDETYSNVAIFYSVLSTSAFHLRGSQSGGSLDKIAREFRLQAIKYLRKGIEKLAAPSNPNNTLQHFDMPTSRSFQRAMAATLTLVTSDVVDGKMDDYWIHLNGVDQIRKQWQNQDKPSATDKRLFTIASFLKALAATTSTEPLTSAYIPQNNPPPFRLDTSQFPDNFGLEHTYGITSTLAGFISHITTLSTYISYFVSRDVLIPQALIMECLEVSSALDAWSIADEELPSLNDTNEITQHLGKLHITAFAAAIRVYYHTRVLPCDEALMVEHIQHVAEYLMEIERIKADLLEQTLYQVQPTASITWPGFIASCEATGEYRSIWHQWWHSMMQYQIGNIARLWEVVQESWILRDSGVREVPAWVPVLRRTGRRILAI